MKTSFLGASLALVAVAAGCTAADAPEAASTEGELSVEPPATCDVRFEMHPLLRSISTVAAVRGDFDRDGVDDVAVLANNAIQIFRGGAGGLAPGPTTPSPELASSDPLGTQVRTGDFDGDGKLDIVTVSTRSGGGDVFFFKGKGDATFAAGTRFPRAAATATPTKAGLEVQTGDFDGDHKLDLLVRTATTADVFYGGAFGEPTSARIPPLDDAAAGSAVGDLDGDGRPELIVTERTAIVRYEAVGRAGFVAAAMPWREQAPVFMFGVHAVAVADLDGSGTPDLVVGAAPGDVTTGATATLSYQGIHFSLQGRPARRLGPLHSVNLEGSSIEKIADFDGDGKPDLLLRQETSFGVGFDTFQTRLVCSVASEARTNLGTSPGAPSVAVPDLIDEVVSTVVYGDFDGDGRTDAVRVRGWDVEVFYSRSAH